MNVSSRVLALSGGIGGAKLALGLQQVLPPGELAVLVNTGDDFRHVGLAISPDLDTMLYTLAGVANTDAGWGRADESWRFHDELVRRGGPDWFRLGDRDLVVHVERTQRLAVGESLAAITADFTRRFEVPTAIWPMSDDPVMTVLETDEGTLEFQHYFVRRRCEPAVRSVEYRGADHARANAQVVELLESPVLAAVVVCPSNPWLSLGPMLAIKGLRDALQRCDAPVVVVSPIIGGEAVKGPTTKLMRELGLAVTQRAIAELYADFADGLVLDVADASQAATVGLPTLVTATLMQTLEDRERVARAALDFAQRLGSGSSPHRRSA